MLLTGSGRLAVAQPQGWPTPGFLSPWALLVGADGRISWVGAPQDAPRDAHSTDLDRLDLGTALVTPGLVDAHTHPVYAGDRSDEAAARLAGTPYSGGGILRTVAATRETPDVSLQALVAGRLHAAQATGTTTIECKTGYGLSLSEELRHLRILQQVAERLPIRVVRTFLGAHAVPADALSPATYVDTLIDEMLPAFVGQADFVDVFCDAGFFSVDDAERILNAAAAHGLGLRLHAEQLARTGAAELGIRLGAASVDHLERLDAEGVAALAASSTVATLLPGPAVTMRGPLPPARALLDAGARVALASDANAGTYANSSMPLAIGLGATLLGMNVGEALAAATAGGAAALRLSEVCGVVRAGLAADLVEWDAEHEGAFALRLGAVRPLRTWIGGVEV